MLPDLSASSHRHRKALRSSKTALRLFPDRKIRGRARMRLIVSGHVRGPYRHEPVRVFIRKRREEYGLHDREDGCRRTDSQGQRQDCGHGEARRPAKLMQSEPDVRPDAFKRGPLPDLAAAFLNQRRIAEFATGSPCRLVSAALTSSIEFFRALFKVVLDGDREIFIAAATRDETLDPSHGELLDLCCCKHAADSGEHLLEARDFLFKPATTRSWSADTLRVGRPLADIPSSDFNHPSPVSAGELGKATLFDL